MGNSLMFSCDESSLCQYLCMDVTQLIIFNWPHLFSLLTLRHASYHLDCKGCSHCRHVDMLQQEQHRCN